MVRHFYTDHTKKEDLESSPQVPLHPSVPLLPSPPPGSWVFVVAVPWGYQPVPVTLQDGSVWLLPNDPDLGPHVLLLAAPLPDVG